MEKKNIWSTDDIIQNRNNWSLAGDAELLKHLQALSEVQLHYMSYFTGLSWCCFIRGNINLYIVCYF